MTEYEFGEIIGTGGFGEVLEAKRLEDDWLCAIKRLLSSNDEDDQKRFKREVRMQTQLRHRNVVQIIKYSLEDDPPWFVMPRALFNLKEYLNNNKGEDELWIFYQIAAGLKHAHDNGVIHRDLKPKNVLFFRDQDNRLYVSLSDFGLGRFVSRDSTSLTKTNIPMGTIEYMAPEQYTDAKNVDSKADIYAIGKILYEILTGEVPFPEINYSKVSSKFVYIIQKACQNNPDKRYSNIEEMVNDLVIVTRKEKLLTKPAETIRNEMQLILEEKDFTTLRTKNLARLLLENIGDNVVLNKILPKLPDPILQSLIKNHISTLSTVLEAFDEAVRGHLPFKYCDVVANFYEKVFYWTDSNEVKTMILRRLPKLGFYNNRWYVGEIFSKIVDSLKDLSLILVVKEILESNNSIAYWNKSYLEKYSLPPMIRNIIKNLKPPF